MQINNLTASASGRSSYAMSTGGVNQDEQIKSYQKQIENLQKQLQSLSDNENLSPEEMMEKRKEIQQKIQELNKQISQRKMEIQKEKREAATAEKQETGKSNSTKEDYATIGTGTMQGLISADASMKRINTVQSVKTDMEGRARVLKREIEVDKGRGNSTEKKEAELAELNDRINTTTKDIMDRISDLTAEMEKPGEESDENDGIERKQGENTIEDNAEANEIDHSDVQGHTNNIHDKPVIYTKSGSRDQQEPEANVSVLV